MLVIDEAHRFHHCFGHFQTNVGFVCGRPLKLCVMAPKASQQGQLGKGQRAISSFFKPKASPPSTATVAQSPCSEQAVPHSTAAAGVTQPLQDHAMQSGNRLPESTPVSVNTERPTKRAKLSPAATPSQHSTVTIAIDFDDDNTEPHNSSSDLPAPDATPGEQSTALPSKNSMPPSAPMGAHSADTIPPRHAGRHMRFQHKLAKESSKEPAAGEVPKQAFTPLELQIVELKKRHPGVLLIVEVGYKFRFFGDDAQVASQVGSWSLDCDPGCRWIIPNTKNIPVSALSLKVTCSGSTVSDG